MGLGWTLLSAVRLWEPVRRKGTEPLSALTQRRAWAQAAWPGAAPQRRSAGRSRRWGGGAAAAGAGRGRGRASGQAAVSKKVAGKGSNDYTISFHNLPNPSARPPAPAQPHKRCTELHHDPRAHCSASHLLHQPPTSGTVAPLCAALATLSPLCLLSCPRTWKYSIRPIRMGELPLRPLALVTKSESGVPAGVIGNSFFSELVGKVRVAFGPFSICLPAACPSAGSRRAQQGSPPILAERSPAYRALQKIVSG